MRAVGHSPTHPRAKGSWSKRQVANKWSMLRYHQAPDVSPVVGSELASLKVPRHRVRCHYPFTKAAANTSKRDEASLSAFVPAFVPLSKSWLVALP